MEGIPDYGPFWEKTSKVRTYILKMWLKLLFALPLARRVDEPQSDQHRNPKSIKVLKASAQQSVILPSFL